MMQRVMNLRGVKMASEPRLDLIGRSAGRANARTIAAGCLVSLDYRDPPGLATAFRRTRASF
jgi:hypothetical protein